MIKTYDMNGMEPDSKMEDIRTLSVNQRAIFESVEIPSSLGRLYKIHTHKMPESSVRRILHTLKNKHLIEKLDSEKWRQIRF